VSKIFFIAEAGVNHNGDLERGKRLIDIAAEAGADAVKFQTWKTDLIVTQSAKQARYQTQNTGKQESQYEMLKKLELTYLDFYELSLHCKKQGIAFMSTPDEVESALFLTDLQEIFKIGSGEITNLPFLRFIGSLGKSVILSTGMSSLIEVEEALEVLQTSGTPLQKITILHCTSQYPAPISDVNLRAMQTLRDTFRTDVGYSDHTLGIEVAIAAAALGASVIEKHFTLDCNLPGPDHKASIEPRELKRLVTAIRNIEVALGDGVKCPMPSEYENKDIVRKSIVASKPILKGEILTLDNLTVKRPGNGISPMQWDSVIGKTASKDFSIDDLISL